MLNFEQFNESIAWSGKNPTKMPIIGTVKTKPMEMGDWKFPSEILNVVEIIDDIYVIDRFYKPGVPQLVHKELVEKYTPKK